MTDAVATPHSMRDAPDEWISLTTAFMTHRATLPDRLAAAERVAPHAPALLAAKGLMLLLLGRGELMATARDLHQAAQTALKDHHSDHDARYVSALAAWLNGAPSQAADAFDEVVRRNPGDAMAVKLSQAIRFVRGDSAGMRQSADKAAALFSNDHPHAGYVKGCLAFACEETGDLSLAEAAGHRALELAPDDAWALHAVAHVHEMRGHAAAGRDWLLPRETAFAGCANFRFHVWWHLALFEMELGNVDAVLALYDQKIRSEHTDDYRDIANAVSLLARLDLDGVDVGNRWEELSALAEARIEDACIVFADLHYLLALLAADRHEAADRLIGRMAEAGEGSEFARVAQDAGAVAGGGLAALRRGLNEDAFKGLLAARSVMSSIGGSHAQRDVFERLTIDAALRAGRGGEARALIKDRAQRRSSYDRFAFERLAMCGPIAVNAPTASAAAF